MPLFSHKLYRYNCLSINSNFEIEKVKLLNFLENQVLFEILILKSKLLLVNKHPLIGTLSHSLPSCDFIFTVLGNKGSKSVVNAKNGSYI